MKTRTLFIFLLLFSVISCSKDSGSSGNLVYYVIKATYDNPADHGGAINAEVTHVALTMPSGSNSTSENLSTPHTTAEREYPAGMTVTATCESVLTHVTVTVEIWRNKVKWKYLTVPGSNSYTDVTVTGTL
jgi:hypothetical protein